MFIQFYINENFESNEINISSSLFIDGRIVGGDNIQRSID
jgi:hypothetical protein